MRLRIFKKHVVFVFSIFILTTASSTVQSEVIGTLKDVVLSIDFGSDFVGRVSSISGRGIIKNKNGDIIAEGSL